MTAHLVDKEWDVIVVGAGMGGGVVGRRLAERGLSVLYVETGPNAPRAEASEWMPDVEDPDERAALGYWPRPIHQVIDGRSTTLYGPFGTGVGGTSAFYAATLERPERHDIDDSAEIPHPTGGWPVSYDEMLPYFEMAEQILDVCGEPDPLTPDPPRTLRQAPPLSEGDAAMIAAFRREGLHPYRKHVGVRYLPGCAECFGRKCGRDCKMDGRSAGVEPALSTGRAALLDRCEIRALRGTRDRITHLEAVRGGERLRLRARRFVLAAGTFGTPRILLASTSADWPNGVANDSGVIGGNLMFKLYERIAVWPERRADFTGPVNTISVRDFYQRDGVRYGHFQSMGLSASYGDIVKYLKERFDQSTFRRLTPLRAFARVPAFAGAKIFGDARIFQGLLEDLPYRHNRIVFDPARPERIEFEYTLTAELLARRRIFRRMIKTGLGRQRSSYLHMGPELSLSHACGTARFGTDPRTSAFDASCKAHGIDNLYVSDASFMPTSTGINPSLTIAANALRVADAIVAATQARDAAGAQYGT
ncbi:MAG: GMC family oxidoreductase [Amaricoccus sp.]|uniref:GMC family oxidoreductase n=1 Tax=Amaricoccus sp. TaxID=1872485 RepID=UPI003315687B